MPSRVGDCDACRTHSLTHSLAYQTPHWQRQQQQQSVGHHHQSSFSQSPSSQQQEVNRSVTVAVSSFVRSFVRSFFLLSFVSFCSLGGGPLRNGSWAPESCDSTDCMYVGMYDTYTHTVMHHCHHARPVRRIHRQAVRRMRPTARHPLAARRPFFGIKGLLLSTIAIHVLACLIVRSRGATFACGAHAGLWETVFCL